MLSKRNSPKGPGEFLLLEGWSRPLWPRLLPLDMAAPQNVASTQTAHAWGFTQSERKEVWGNW